MTKPSDAGEDWDAQREKIIGLGERSLRKTYYPELQQKLDELERFRSLLDESNDCIFLFQVPSFAFVDVNESACRQLDCPREKFLSLSLENLVPVEDLLRIRQLATAAITDGRDKGTIMTQLNKCSGGEFPAEITIRIVNLNKACYGVAVARDITERLQAQKVLLENSRMLRDMELARQIQLSLLPGAPPRVPGVRLAGCCVPATHVGGDYYDYYIREKGTLDLVVADVSGHSIGAALMTAEARSVLRAQFHSSPSAGKLLAYLNDVLYDDLNRAGLFITLFYVKYDPESRMLAYANAGHVSPLLLRPPEVSCRKLDAEGLIIGVREDETYEEKELQMQPGDLLVLYTDGITEAQNSAGEMFGFSRLCSIVSAISSNPPEDVVSIVLEQLAGFTGTTALEDDVTMIVMKVI
ncbi:sensor phosphatase, sensory_box and SpoIIE domain-containing [Geotalea daltonii FRC-32]|uniref:Sensor phosphatase, sensory_box and SpoIIE domain-containing n=1 Tax=Geotalea daltonii (strain DSM 22248 / JCM 15807 / FRC-32) TaxID=316067 RepID=B9M977_GEODF|nr:SpoIIE family protein phosphatase [Geotalea daltonii]ACM18635.1 sensor phosphatase, sensory_box and SpoIIE domain-containing [Geotalea daltonii FRC-32]